MDLRRSRPWASREPDAGEAEADKEKDDRDSKSPICGSGDAEVTAKLGKTGRAGRAEATAARMAGCGCRSSGMKVAIHLAFLRIVPPLLIRGTIYITRLQVWLAIPLRAIIEQTLLNRSSRGLAPNKSF